MSTLFIFQLAAESSSTTADVVVIVHVVQLPREVRGEDVLDVGGQVQSCSTVFDCLGRHTYDYAVGVARAVVACWLVDVDLVVPWVNRWVGLAGAWAKDCLVPVLVVGKVVVVVFMPHLQDEAKTLLEENTGVECVVRWSRGEGDMEGGCVSTSLVGSVLVVRATEGATGGLFRFEEVHGVDL